MSDQTASPEGLPATGKRYWRSLEEVAETPEFLEFLHREFPKGAAELLGGRSGATRRGFLKLMGASLALAGVGSLGGCIHWPEQKILPYAHRPPNRTDGIPVSYATAFELGGVAQGLLVTSYDGRPIKIEGNPGHPLNMGATDVLAQASVLGLYDQDRSRGVIRKMEGRRDVVGWEEFAAWAHNTFKGSGAGIAVLSEASGSPSVLRLRGDLAKKLPGMKWYEYEAVGGDNVREGLRTVYGTPLRPVWELSQAKVVVALEAELFGGGDPRGEIRARFRVRPAAGGRPECRQGGDEPPLRGRVAVHADGGMRRSSTAAGAVEDAGVCRGTGAPDRAGPCPGDGRIQRARQGLRRSRR